MKIVKDIMVNYPKSCTKHDSLKNVVTEMSNSNIGSLPVLDENKRVIGIITDRDITLTLGKTGRNVNELRVADAMTNSAHTVTPEDDTATALRIMRTKKVGRLPVVDHEQRLRGIVSLNRIVKETHGRKDAPELQYGGQENVINTLYSIAERNRLQEGME
jgi:CBS domain-containing protein